MRRFWITTLAGVVLFSCSRPNKDSAKQQDDEHEKDDEQPKQKASAKSDDDEPKPAKKPAKARVRAHDGVPRYPADAGWGFAKREFMKRYSIGFPEDLEFKVTEKKDHASHVASKVHKGTIYRVEVRDYSKSKSGDAAHKELGFLKFSATKEAEFFGGKVAQRSDVELRAGGDPIPAYYMTYSFELDEKEYFVDWLALNVGDHVIVLSTSSRPKYEAAARMEEFFNSFAVRD